jgi:hypothetical protein
MDRLFANLTLERLIKNDFIYYQGYLPEKPEI